MVEQPAESAAARPPLSKRQGEILTFIRTRVAKMGYPPTFREICHEFNLRSTNGVADHIKALKRKGYLTFQQTKSRTLRPIEAPARKKADVATRDAKNHPATQSVPVLGRIAAGEPILAPGDAQPERHIQVDASLLRGHNDTFALEVSGDSMIEAGILDGDTVFVCPRNYADSGQIAVVLLDNEATLKRYYKEKDRVRLQPANGTLKPRYIYPSDAQPLRILGIVTGVWRQLG